MKDKEGKAEMARQGFLHQIGVDLMNAYNRDKTDPVQMAAIGHDSSDGYEFCIERAGHVAVVTVRMDWSG